MYIPISISVHLFVSVSHNILYGNLYKSHVSYKGLSTKVMRSDSIPVSRTERREDIPSYGKVLPCVGILQQVYFYFEVEVRFPGPSLVRHDGIFRSTG